MYCKCSDCSKTGDFTLSMTYLKCNSNSFVMEFTLVVQYIM